LTNVSYLKKIIIIGVEKASLRGDLTALYNYLTGGCSAAGVGFFSQSASDRMRGNGLKLH